MLPNLPANICQLIFFLPPPPSAGRGRGHGPGSNNALLRGGHRHRSRGQKEKRPGARLIHRGNGWETALR